MRRVPHDLKLAALVSVALAGCNIVQGFQDAGDSLFPEQSTHLASPGLQLVRGHYRGLGLIGGSELYLIARGADDDSGKLYSIRYADPKPCEIPEVGRFYSTRERSRAAPLLAYFNDDARRGTLHFADAACNAYPFSMEDARLPVAETEHGVVVWAGSDLWLATPETSTQRKLSDGVDEVIRSVFGRRFAVRANGRLKLFDSFWNEQGTFGDEVSSVLRLGQSLFFLDATGLHRIVAASSGSGVVEDAAAFVGDACSIASQDDKWLLLRAPCEDGETRVIYEPTGRSFTLPFDANPRQLRLVPARGSRGRDPSKDPFWFFYVRSGDDEASQNTLFVRTPEGSEHALGANSTLSQLRLLESDRETHGYALVDIDGDTGRYVWWNPEGETRTLSDNALLGSDRLIVDSDGTVGNVAVTSGDRLRVVAEGVPWQAFEYTDQTGGWTALFHDMKDGVGRLSSIPNGLSDLEAVPEDAPFEAPALSGIASNVAVLSTLSLDDVLSGVVYLTDYDLTTRTGHLAYSNLDLRFTADVNDGVSDYLVTHDEVLYTIPYGDDAGIWIVEGK